MKISTLFLAVLFAWQTGFSQSFFFNVHEPSWVKSAISDSAIGKANGWGGPVLSTTIGELIWATDENDNHFLCDISGYASDAFAGKIVLVDRQTCEFSLKALHAQQLGAVGVIIRNFEESVLSMGAGASGSLVTIPVIMVKPSQIQAAFVELLLGSQVIVSFSPSPVGFATIQGQVTADGNPNCQPDSGEPGLKNWKITAQNSAGNSISVFTNAEGRYKFWADTGTWQISAQPTSPLWAACGSAVTATFTNFDTTTIDFSGKKLVECPQMQVEIGSSILRRCFDSNQYTVNWCNIGTIPAVDAAVEVQFDSLIEVISTSQPFENLGGNLFRFQIGSPETGDCGTIQIVVKVSCDAQLGQTLCATAHALPDTICASPTGLWLGADLHVDGACNFDSVKFEIENRGTGDMAGPLNWRIFRNGSLLSSGVFQLAAGEILSVAKAEQAGFWRLETDPIPFHPSNSKPAKMLEACWAGAPFLPDVFQSFPMADYGLAWDEDCTEVRGAYDPNDKRGIPQGVGNQHFITRGQDIDYRIRFQNTGTDTAFTVVVVDTLSAFLEPNSIRFGASSHLFEASFPAENVLRFSFKNILLPDSFVNEAASHSFLDFTISQKTDLPLGSEIRNRAGIYFDFNAPVMTNETWHTIGENFIPLAIAPVVFEDEKVEVLPNPMTESCLIRLKNRAGEPLFLRLFAADGRLILEKNGAAGEFSVSRNEVPAGLLHFVVEADGQRVAVGKLAVF